MVSEVDWLSGQSDNSAKYIEVLVRLGLAHNEARIFLSLYRIEEPTATAISKTSGVAREIVYQVMPKLEQKGLVEEVIASPKRFKAISINSAFSILFAEREKENQELYKKSKEIMEKKQNSKKNKIEEAQIKIIPPRKEDATWKKEWYSYQVVVDLIMPLNKFLQWPQNHAETSIDGAIKRKLKMRMITEKGVKDILAAPSPEIFPPSLIPKLKYIKFKFVDNTPVELVIFDRKKLFVSTQKEKRIEKMKWLFSNNPFLVEMANNYFETLWSIAKEGQRKQLYHEIPIIASSVNLLGL